MHSNIFKLQPDLNKEYDLLREEEYYDNGFLDNIADYVNGDVDLMDEYEWLTDCSMKDLFCVRFDGEIESDEKKYPLAYLDVDIAKANEWLDERLKKYTDIVAKDPRRAFDWEVKSMLGDKFGFYFDIDGWGYMCDVEFIRYCINHYKQGTATFRLEGVLDYHW